MALTYTPASTFGATCPDFTLPSVDGKSVSLTDFANAPVLVVMFLCNHCPYVKAIEDRLLILARDLIPRGAAFFAICSNDPVDYPEDAPGELFTRWREKNYGFPYLVDSEQTVARAFGAVCTPDLFVYDHQRKLCYRGRLDDSWRNPLHVTRQELRIAIEQSLDGRPMLGPQNPAMGCSIKWKKG